jgi:hypothetical protein
MKRARQRAGIACVLAMLASLPTALPVSTPASAGWLSKIGKIADDTGGAGAALRHGVPGDEFAGAFGRHLKSLPADAQGGAALAAHATPEGHWRFTNRQGEHFTAANVAEMERVAATLLPESAPGMKLELYLSEDIVFMRPDLVKGLPADANLHLLAGKGAYKLSRAAGDPLRFTAEIRPHLKLDIGERRLFDEAVWQLSRPLNRSNMRVVALEPGGAHTIPSVPKLDPATKAAQIDRVDPWKLPSALRSLRGQTVVVTGRVEGKTLRFKPEGGAEKTLLVDDLMSAAREADVNLVLLQSDKTLQPGGRNWLWQTLEVKGLDDALKRSTLADFLDALGANRGGLAVEASQSVAGRARLDIVPQRAAGVASEPITDAVTGWAGDVVARALGNVVVEAIKVDSVDKERQEELDRRIVPGIPSLVQWTWLAGIVMGLIGYAYSWRWFARAWPAEERAEYAGAAGYYLARLMRGLAYLLVFLPIAGIPAGVWAMLVGLAEQVWAGVTAPYRLVRWIGRKLGLARQPADAEKG